MACEGARADHVKVLTAREDASRRFREVERQYASGTEDELKTLIEAHDELERLSAEEQSAWWRFMEAKEQHRP